MKKETYFSVDVESDGPIPGPNSMLSFGAAVFTDTQFTGKTFAANLKLLPDAHPDPKTSAFWAKNSKSYDATRRSTEPPAVVMPRFVDWVEKIAHETGTRPVFIGFPATYDFMFMYWYLMKFAGESPFSHAGMDIKTMAATVLGIPYRNASKRNLPKEWFEPNLKHTHIALDDAIEQGHTFIRILKSNVRTYA